MEWTMGTSASSRTQGREGKSRFSKTSVSDVCACASVQAHSLNRVSQLENGRSALGCPQRASGNGFLQSWGLTEEKRNQ